MTQNHLLKKWKRFNIYERSWLIRRSNCRLFRCIKPMWCSTNYNFMFQESLFYKIHWTSLKNIIEIFLSSLTVCWLIFAVKLYINFCQISLRGELGIDSGGLEREYWTLMGREILRKYFEGEEGNCIVRRDTSSLMVSKPIDSKNFIKWLF